MTVRNNRSEISNRQSALNDEISLSENHRLQRLTGQTMFFH